MTDYYCLRCRTVAQPGEKRCVRCGARFRGSGASSMVYLVLLCGLATVLVVGVVGLWQSARSRGEAETVKDGTTPARTTTIAPSATTTAAAEPAPTAVAATPQPLTGVQVTASATAGASQNNCGEQTTYDATNTLDGNPATTWRVKGDGTGQTLAYGLTGPTKVTQVGLVPGYVKVDPCSGSDRFLQLRRVTKVRWVFDGGIEVEQALADTREMQTLDVDVVTRTVTLEILGTTGKASIDYTPVAEVRLVGAPTG